MCRRLRSRQARSDGTSAIRNGNAQTRPRPGDRGEHHQAHPTQPARLDEVAVGGANRITVDALGRDPLAATALDRIVQSQDHGATLRKRIDEEPEQDTAAGARAPRRPAEDAVDVYEPPLLRAADDAQDACHRALPRREDRADQQVLGVSPRAVDEQRCEGQDDLGEAGGQGEHGGVSWRGRHQPIRHARFVTSHPRSPVQLAKVELRRHHPDQHAH